MARRLTADSRAGSGAAAGAPPRTLGETAPGFDEPGVSEMPAPELPEQLVAPRAPRDPAAAKAAELAVTGAGDGDGANGATHPDRASLAPRQSMMLPPATISLGHGAVSGNGGRAAQTLGEKTASASRSALGGDRFELPSGSLIEGKYRVVRQLGRGGMGYVYEVINLATDGHLALKLLLTREADAAHAARERMRREARIGASVRHPSLLQIFDYQEGNGTVQSPTYLVMELVDGMSLEDHLLERGTFSPEQAVAAILPLLDGVRQLHAMGVVHRDIKPANLMVTGAAVPTLKLLDYGVARGPNVGVANSTLTVEGRLLGTPQYMPLEQLHDAAVDCRADVFALGSVLFEMVTGCLPFPATTLTERVLALSTEGPRDLQERMRRMVPALGDCLATAMAREAAARFATVESFGASLSQALTSLQQRPLVGRVTADTTTPGPGERPDEASIDTEAPELAALPVPARPPQDSRFATRLRKAAVTALALLAGLTVGALWPRWRGNGSVEGAVGELSVEARSLGPAPSLVDELSSDPGVLAPSKDPVVPPAPSASDRFPVPVPRAAEPPAIAADPYLDSAPPRARGRGEGAQLTPSSRRPGDSARVQSSGQAGPRVPSGCAGPAGDCPQSLDFEELTRPSRERVAPGGI